MNEEPVYCEYDGTELPAKENAKYRGAQTIGKSLFFCSKECAVNYLLENPETRKWIKQEVNR